MSLRPYQLGDFELREGFVELAFNLGENQIADNFATAFHLDYRLPTNAQISRHAGLSHFALKAEILDCLTQFLSFLCHVHECTLLSILVKR